MITDRKLALSILEENLSLNKHNIAAKAQPLEWGNIHDLQLHPKPYNVILGADIIYIEETFEALLHTFLHLSDCTTKVFLSCKIRYDRDTKFLSLMKQHFTIEEVYYDKSRDIHIYEGLKICSS